MVGDAVKKVHHRVHDEEEDREVEQRPHAPLVAKPQQAPPPEQDADEGHGDVGDDAGRRESDFGRPERSGRPRDAAGEEAQQQVPDRQGREEHRDVSGRDPKRRALQAHGAEQAEGLDQSVHGRPLHSSPHARLFNEHVHLWTEPQ
jgi:hypothetical protein